MTAKEYLEQIRNYEKRISHIQEEIERLEAVATNTTQTLTGMPHNPSPSQSRMADAVCKLIDKQEELRKEMVQLETLRTEVTAIIAQLSNPDERDVLYKRYIESKTWEDIAIEMYFSKRMIYYHHNAALKSFETILNQSV